MEKFYSLLIATGELLTCPAIRSYGQRHDAMVPLGAVHAVDLMLPVHLGVGVYPNVYLEYNPHMVDIFYAHLHEVIGHYSRKTVLTLRLRTRDVGSTTIALKSGAPAEELVSHLYETMSLKPPRETYWPAQPQQPLLV